LAATEFIYIQNATKTSENARNSSDRVLKNSEGGMQIAAPMVHVKEALSSVMWGLGDTGLAVRALPPSARRPIAALWFAGFAALATFLFFLRLVMAPHAVILYVVVPSLAAGIAGYIWGGAILDPSRVQNYAQALLRGFIAGAGTFVIFAALYACVLPTLEGQWSLGRVGSLFLFTLMLGVLMGGPLAAVTGMTAGMTLFKFGRHFFESGGRHSEASSV
jgi:hypothetical protein